MSPGAGAGNEAAAVADIMGAIPMLTKHLNSFPLGDKRRQALMQAVMRLESQFGKSNDEALTPAAMTRMTRAAQAPGGPARPGMPPPGMALGGPQPTGMGALGGMMGGG
ncbi:MAG TPA: hypothetical protein VF742_06915 [Terracidiphilus sp.]